MSAGHREEMVLDGYPLGKVLIYHQALQENHRQEVWQRAVGVSLGIRDALSKKGPLAAAWLKTLPETKTVKPLAMEDSGLAQLIKRMPVERRKRRGKTDGD